MNKRMRELFAKIQNKSNEIDTLLKEENTDMEQVEKLLEEAEALEKEYEAEKRLYELNKKNGINAIAEPVQQEAETEKDNKLGVVEKFGAAAKTGFTFNKDMSEGSLQDGGYSVPEDVVTLIQNRRDAKFSLLHLVTVIPTKTNKGSRTFKKRTQQTGFTKVGEGGAIGKKNTPQFERLEYEIEKYAGYFPVTNELLEDSDSNIGAILIEWIGDDSRVTANNLIRAELESKEAVDLVNMDGIKKAINVTLGQTFKPFCRIVTNDDGLQYLDTLKDSNGRDLLAPIPGENMKPYLCVGTNKIPVEVIGNTDLPTKESKIPFYIGDFKEGIVYWDRKKMNIKISDTAAIGELNAFEEDLTIYRAIEREDVTVRDDAAFVNGYITQV